MFKTAFASLALATALFASSLPVTVPAEAGTLRKIVKIGAAVVVTGLVIRCGVRVSSGRSCL
jgi:hypothetical protein